MTRGKNFRLTAELVAANAGSPVVCLATSAIGQTFRLHASRPGPGLNRPIRAGGVVVDPNGNVEGEPLEETSGPPPVIRVDISGVIEQRAGYHSECGGWSDGHDAIAERMIAALEVSDVLLVIDSPGGAHAGLESAVARVMQEKEEHGRRVTVYCDEMIGSAAYWWAACVGDEIYAPSSGIVGSIGARASHGSVAGMLAKDGIEVTYFAWPGAGKVAFAPELPLSDLGRQRGERDTAIAGESFAAAVGPRRGMTREEIIELDADALCGEMAVTAKLIDAVANFEDVLSYCIASAERAGDSEMSAENLTAVAADKNVAQTAAVPAAIRTEEPAEPEPEPGKEPDGVCKSCGHQQEENAKYCDQCGESMEAAPLEDPDGDGDDDGKKKAADSAAAAPKKAAPPMKETGATLATLLGLRKGASELAIKTALVQKLQVLDFVTSLTGATGNDQMIGQLRAMSEDAAESGKLRQNLAAMRERADSRERLDLLLSLVAAGLPDYPRGNLLIDEVADNGRVTSVQPAPAYAEMRIGTLRGLVKAKLANAAPAAARSPYVAEPDPAKASTLNDAARDAARDAAALEEAKKNPIVIKMAKDGISLDTAAAIYVREFGRK